MAALQVRGLPEQVVLGLRERADRHGRTLQEELRQVLAAAAADETAAPDAVFEPVQLHAVRGARSALADDIRVRGDDTVVVIDGAECTVLGEHVTVIELGRSAGERGQHDAKGGLDAQLRELIASRHTLVDDGDRHADLRRPADEPQSGHHRQR